MGRLARNILLAAIIGFGTCAGLQHASAESGGIHENRPAFSIAVPDFSDGATTDGVSWSAMARAIASDLTATGRVALIESNLPVESNVPAEGRVDPSPPHFDRWRETDAKWLVIGRISKQDQRLFVRFQLWDVLKAQQVLGQQYAVGSDDMPRIPQVIAERILQKLAGASGAAAHRN